MDAPVLGAAAELGGFVDEDHGRVGLLEEEEVEDEGGEAHDGGEVGGPAPAQIGHVDEPADKRGEERAEEDHAGEHGDGDAAGAVVEDIGEDGGHDGERAAAEDAAEEAADQ